MNTGGGRNHGSRDRVPGALFRAMGAMYLDAKPEVPRESVVKKLTSRLMEQGIEYHVRTVRRQLLGVVESVPPEVERELRRLIQEDLGWDDETIERKLNERGVVVPEELRRSVYVPIARAERLARLWLHLNPGKSKRSLATKLSGELSAKGVALSTDSLQSQLAGKGYLVRRELLEMLATYLEANGIKSLEEAEARAADWQGQIDESLEGRSLVDSERFQSLCRLWQLQHREASSRRLAQLLRQKLEAQGLDVGIHHLQRSIAGKTPRVRSDLLDAMDELLAETPAPAAPAEEGVAPEGARPVDLAWVSCEPISKMAEEWLEAHSGASMRQLALKVAATIRKMGYASSHNTIQPILGGWKKKTRGYVYRAVLRQFPDRAEQDIPAEHVVGAIPGEARRSAPRSAPPPVLPLHEAAAETQQHAGSAGVI